MRSKAGHPGDLRTQSVVRFAESSVNLSSPVFHRLELICCISSHLHPFWKWIACLGSEPSIAPNRRHLVLCCESYDNLVAYLLVRIEHRIAKHAEMAALEFSSSASPLP